MKLRRKYLKPRKKPKGSRPHRDKGIFQGRAIDELGERKFSGFRDLKRLRAPSATTCNIICIRTQHTTNSHMLMRTPITRKAVKKTLLKTGRRSIGFRSENSPEKKYTGSPKVARMRIGKV